MVKFYEKMAGIICAFTVHCAFNIYDNLNIDNFLQKIDVVAKYPY